jgi:hypothetical protein
MRSVFFTHRDIGLIKKALPADISPRKLQLLPRILKYWAHSDLPEHLAEEQASTITGRVTRIGAVARSASELFDALDALKRGNEEVLVITQILKAKAGIADARALQASKKRFEEERAFLTELKSGAAASAKHWKRGQGQPQNVVASLVIRDIAAFFEWLTGHKATRQVSRANGRPTGAFYDFAAALWPTVFGQGDDGLQAAIKKLSAAKKNKVKGTTSPVLFNIAARNPKWRIF